MFRTPWETLVALLGLTGFLYAGSIIFLVGVQLDELLENGELEPFLRPGPARAGGRPARARR